MAEVLPAVDLIDLHFLGRHAALGAYLLQGADGTAALIDPGPSSTLPALLDGIRHADVAPERIVDILATHIHLDHSGGVGVLLRDHFPNARVYVHPAGLPHLVDPARLVRSAARLYGEKMDLLWGEVATVPEGRVAPLDDRARIRLAGHDLDIFFTPGHANHHVAARLARSGAIFSGDVAGVRVPGANIVSPPAVPPEFDLGAWEQSIDLLQSLKPEVLLLGHFGPAHDAQAHLEQLRSRLHEWTAFVADGLANGRDLAALSAELEERDASAPGVTRDGLRRLDLVAGYGMSMQGIARYLTKQSAKS